MAGLDDDYWGLYYSVQKRKFTHDEIIKNFLNKRIIFFEGLNEAYNKGNAEQFIKTKSESAKKEKYRLREKDNQRLGYIYNIKTLVKNLKINEKTIRDLIHKDQEKDFYSRNFAIWKSGTRILFEKEKLHKFISKNSYKYEKGI
ncbi:MAG: hypothetical protein VZR11_09100, partial [Succinimonas sp.]|nr:hypothetical protein [Succinimonas sp.]